MKASAFFACFGGGVALLAAAIGGWLYFRAPTVKDPKPALRITACPAVSNELTRIERVFSAVGAEIVRLDTRELKGEALAERLRKFTGALATLWMPGESDWLVVNFGEQKKIGFAAIMEAFAAENCAESIGGFFASYVGEVKGVLPALAGAGKEQVVYPEYLVPVEVPELSWVDFSEIDEDILALIRPEIRHAQNLRRRFLQGVMNSREGDEQGSLMVWRAVALANPNDSMLKERLEHVWVNAEVFMKLGKIALAAKCYETLLAIRPQDQEVKARLVRAYRMLGRKDLVEAIGRGK